MKPIIQVHYEMSVRKSDQCISRIPDWMMNQLGWKEGQKLDMYYTKQGEIVFKKMKERY